MTKVYDTIARFFPARCLACEALIGTDPFLCAPCRGNFPWLSGSACPRCSRPFVGAGTGEHLCGDCLRDHPGALARIYALGEYRGVLHDLIMKMKYRGQEIIAWRLGEEMAHHPLPVSCDWIVPVPLHPRRLRERGYNQAAWLSRALARRWGSHYAPFSLHRCRETPSQTGLKQRERWENLTGSMRVVGEGIQDRTVLLVDDVATTGATLEACSRALKQAGAKEVYAYVAARAA